MVSGAVVDAGGRWHQWWVVAVEVVLVATLVLVAIADVGAA